MYEPPWIIAVVDDEEAVRRGLERLLRSWGLLVVGYESGADFLDSFGRDHPDCVILDLHMPGCDGYEVLERLSRSGSSIPVIVMTGRDTPEAREKTSRFGVRSFFSKPIDGESLHHAILASVGSIPNDAAPPGEANEGPRGYDSEGRDA